MGNGLLRGMKALFSKKKGSNDISYEEISKEISWKVVSKTPGLNEGSESVRLNEDSKDTTLDEALIDDSTSSLILKHYDEIGELFSNYKNLLPDSIANDTNFNWEEIFIFYIFDSLGTRKLEDTDFINTLIDFLHEKNMNKFSDIENMKSFVDKNFLYLKHINVDGENFTLVNVSFINKVYIQRTPLETGYSYCHNTSEKKHEINVERYSEHRSRVIFNNDVFVMDNNQKEQFCLYFNRWNDEIHRKSIEELDMIEIKVKEFDSTIKNLIHNFIREVDKGFFMSPGAFTSLEHAILFYNHLSEYVAQSTEYERHRIAIYLRENEEFFNLLNSTKDEFNKLVTIVGNKINLEDKLVETAVWLEFRNQVKIYFSEKWEKDYGSYFKNIEFDIEEYIQAYCNINELDSQDAENVSYLTYYLMSLGVFDDNGKFNENFNYVLSKVEVIKEKLDLEKYEKKLMVDIEKNKFDFNDVDLLTGLEFEQFIADLFTKMGYRAVITKGSGDQGIDVIAEIEGRRIGIQTKCYGTKVSNSAVQETAAGIAYHKCDKGMVITNNYFTKSAVDLASKNDIILWNRDMLKEKFTEFMN